MKKIWNVIVGLMLLTGVLFNVSCKCSDDRDRDMENNEMTTDTVMDSSYDVPTPENDMNNSSGSDAANNTDNNTAANNDRDGEGVISTSDTVPEENIVPSGGSKGKEVRYSSSGSN